MSDYFKKMNDGREFGVAHNGEIEWLIVQKEPDTTGVSQCAVVKASTAYQAWELAAALIKDFRKQDCLSFPNPKLIFQEKKK